MLSPFEFQRFLTINGMMYYRPICDEEMLRIISAERKGVKLYVQHQFKGRAIYRVSFTEVANAIKRLSCYVHKGFAYVPESEIRIAIVDQFEENIRGGLI